MQWALRARPRPQRARATSRPHDLRVEAPAVTLEQASELGAGDEGERHIAESVGDVERKPAPDYEREGPPVVRPERVPLPHVHEEAEGEAEDEREQREDDTALQRPSEQRARDPARSP